MIIRHPASPAQPWPVLRSQPRWSCGSIAASTAVAQPPAAETASVSKSLPLGPANLAETRNTSTLQPGVTLTTIVRGQAGPESFWTVEVAIPSSSPDPDAPATALSDQATADATAARLRTAGLDPRVENVPTPKLADAGGGRSAIASASAPSPRRPRPMASGRR